jgi:hypothetical protein
MRRPSQSKEPRPVEHRAHDDFLKRFRFYVNGSWGSFKYEGAELLDKVHDWAAKWPLDVALCGIDDSWHSSSDVVLILHRKGTRLWGTTCYVLTQCDGQKPVEFFLYPGHAHGLMEALQVIRTFKPFDKLSKLGEEVWSKHRVKYFGRNAKG